jgi:acylphosphatase
MNVAVGMRVAEDEVSGRMLNEKAGRVTVVRVGNRKELVQIKNLRKIKKLNVRQRKVWGMDLTEQR